MQSAYFGERSNEEIDAFPINQSCDADNSDLTDRTQWNYTTGRLDRDVLISGTGAAGAVGRKCEATTAFGITCTIDGLRAPRRTVFSFLHGPPCEQAIFRHVWEGCDAPGM